MNDTEKTHFAPARRATPETLALDLAAVSRNPLVDALLGMVSGLVAVLNQHRQILAVNKKLLAALGVEDAETLLGLRPGEALACVHADEMPGGCGTSRFCASCGAAIAIVSCLNDHRPVERICAIESRKNGETTHIYLRVSACPVQAEGHSLVLLFLQDITGEQKLAALEHTFFHDISNIVTVLLAASELLTDQAGDMGLRVRHLVQRLAREIDIQKCLTRSRSCTYHPSFGPVGLDRVLSDLRTFFADHSETRRKHLDLPDAPPPITVNTDISLLTRVLTNMVTNALEAAESGETVRLRIAAKGESVLFSVQNPQFIPPETALRIFQRNFSTKPGTGRGLGTFAMKMFGEEVLKGRVDFTTSREAGTEFRLKLPR